MKQLYKNLLLWAVILLMFIAFYQFFNVHTLQPRDLSYGEFLTYVDQGRVRDLKIKGQTYTGHVKDSGTEFRVTGEVPSDMLFDRLHTHGVDFQIEPDNSAGWSLAAGLAGASLLGVAMLIVLSLHKPQSGNAVVIAPSPAKLLKAEDNRVRLSAVGGLGAVRAELETLLRDQHAEAATKLGGRAPRSLLLTGPPGTGKTLVARALAGELGGPLWTLPGSAFFEVYIGSGARRARELFESGKLGPCVLFIDELDAIGRLRTPKGNEHDDTLNELLVQMDQLGEGVFLIAATSRPDLLDPALLRPGRFDRRIELKLPDEAGRLEILQLKTKTLPLGPDVALEPLAATTPGFSGAALEEVVTYAALGAARRGASTVAQADLEQSRERVAGTLAPVAALPDRERG